MYAGVTAHRIVTLIRHYIYDLDYTTDDAIRAAANVFNVTYSEAKQAWSSR